MPGWNFDNAVLALTVTTFNHIADQAMVKTGSVISRPVLFVIL
jgi:hypothetical protein